MRREVIDTHCMPGSAGRVVLLDTIAHLRPEDAGATVVTGSHGGISSGEYAARAPIRAVFFNDAGGGKDEAGRAALPFLDARGIAAGTVSHLSAVIGDAMDAWRSGVISALSPRAEALGYEVGQPLGESIRRVLGERSDA